MAKKQYTMHVLSHTHWDREWYQSFQGYRRRLVYQIDSMMDLLEQRPEFKCFHLDGQTSMLDDYLEIHPEGRDRLAKLIQAGRALIGPWYTMPDEVHVSGESMVRNLLLGHRRCAEWGTKTMPVGFVSDVFSHVSQLPQIFAGFHIDNVFVHHGTTAWNETTEMSWEGADGTEALMIKTYPWVGYQDFMDHRDGDRAWVRKYEDEKIGLASTNIMFGMDGNDHQPAKWNTNETIERMNGYFEHIHAVHSSFPEYLKAVRKALGKNWQKGRKHFKGELRTQSRIGQWNAIYTGTGSSRIPLKQANDHVEYMLARVAEPLNAWGVMLGEEDLKPYLDLGWRYLLLNHPHDSICGCSIDQAHRDMVYRYDQARMLAENAALEGIQDVGNLVRMRGVRKDESVVTVFNMGAAETGPVTELSFDVDSRLAAEKAKEGLVPTLLNMDGKPAGSELLQVERETRPKPFMYKKMLHGITPCVRPRLTDEVDRIRVKVPASVPAIGYKTWRIGFLPKKQSASPGLKPVKTKGAELDNGLVKLSARKDGMIDLYDKATRTWYRGLHFFEDCSDDGDGWDHRFVKRDRRLLSRIARNRGKVSITVEQHGRLSASIKIKTSLKVPADIDDKKSCRSKKLVTVPVETVFTMTSGSARIDCRTTIDNRAKRHRIRVMFPTQRKTDYWYCDTAFDIVKTRIKLMDTTGWENQSREETPTKNLAAICDKRSGLAVLTKGLYDASVPDNEERTMAVTLLRSFVEVLRAVRTEDSLEMGQLTTEYAIMPFVPVRQAPPASIMDEVDRFKVPLLSFSRKRDWVDVVRKDVGHKGPSSAKLDAIAASRRMHPVNLSAQGTLLNISGTAAISTVKVSEDGKAIVARLHNPDTRKAQITVTPSFAFKRASRTDMLEKPMQKYKSKRSVKLTLGAKEIITLRFDR